jgi:hypothetical protein
MSQLMLHRGARVVERAELDLVEAPPPTSSWFPLRHGQVLSTVEETLGNAGFAITRSQFALSQDDARFFGTLDLATPIIDGVAMTVGVRNSTDKTFPIGLCAGNRVFVCDNLAFSAEIYVAKKHTRFGELRFHEGIATAIGSLRQYQDVEARRIVDYRERKVDETEAAACLLHGFEQGILTTRTLPQAIEEWRKPALEDFQPRTAWSLFNAFTSALKERQSNPAQFAALTMRVYRLLDRPATMDALAV